MKNIKSDLTPLDNATGNDLKLLSEQALIEIISDRQKLEKIMKENRLLFLVSFFNALKNSESFRDEVRKTKGLKEAGILTAT